MAKQTIVTCDACGATGPDVLPFKVEVKGGDTWKGDICADCQIKLREQFPGVAPSAGQRKKEHIFDNIVDLDK